MSEYRYTHYVEKQTTPEDELYRRLMSSNEPKTELEWYAARRIERLEAECAELRK